MASPHQCEHGGAFRNPAAGGAFASTRLSGWTNASLWSTPSTETTSLESELGIVSDVAGARSVRPLTEYSFSLTPNAAATSDAVPSAAT